MVLQNISYISSITFSNLKFLLKVSYNFSLKQETAMFWHSLKSDEAVFGSFFSSNDRDRLFSSGGSEYDSTSIYESKRYSCPDDI